MTRTKSRFAVAAFISLVSTVGSAPVRAEVPTPAEAAGAERAYALRTEPVNSLPMELDSRERRRRVRSRRLRVAGYSLLSLSVTAIVGTYFMGRAFGSSDREDAESRAIGRELAGFTTLFTMPAVLGSTAMILSGQLSARRHGVRLQAHGVGLRLSF